MSLWDGHLDPSAPDRPFLITLEPQNLPIHEIYKVQKRRLTNFEALEMRKGRSGSTCCLRQRPLQFCHHPSSCAASGSISRRSISKFQSLGRWLSTNFEEHKNRWSLIVFFLRNVESGLDATGWPGQKHFLKYHRNEKITSFCPSFLSFFRSGLGRRFDTRQGW